MADAVRFDWDTTLETDILWIDVQHKKLIDNMNRLLNSVTTNSDYGSVGRVLRFLTQYVHAHFGTEEQFMRKFGPGAGMNADAMTGMMSGARIGKKRSKRKKKDRKKRRRR